MSTANPSSDPAVPRPAVAWSSETRSAASLLLFAHLFAVVVALTTYTQPSALQRRLHDDVFAVYLRNLHLTPYPISYPFARFHLTHALPADVDFTCQVEVDGANGEKQTVTIPAGGLLPPIRNARYQRLANAAGSLVGEELDEDAAAILPRAIGGAFLKRYGATQGEIRLRAHYLPEIEDMDRVAAGNRAPLSNFADIYQAQVFLSGGRVDILRRSTTLEVAPVETSPRSQPSPGRQPAPRQPQPQQRRPATPAAPNTTP
ncbi:MAG: hypothetical protein AB7O59_23875 [Pirellulales bacterium]